MPECFLPRCDTLVRPDFYEGAGEPTTNKSSRDLALKGSTASMAGQPFLRMIGA